MDSAVAQVPAVPSWPCSPKAWGLDHPPGLLECPRGGTYSTILICNSLILESKLWNLRDVIFFLCNSNEVTGQRALGGNKWGHSKRVAVTSWGSAYWWRFEGYICMLFLATSWSPDIAICSNKLLTSEGLSVQGEVYTEKEHQYLVSHSKGGSCRTLQNNMF